MSIARAAITRCLFSGPTRSLVAQSFPGPAMVYDVYEWTDPMPSYFLHIGTHKTGSTAIQNYLFKNRRRLEESGFCYPEVGLHNTGHHSIAWAAARGNLSALRNYIDEINSYCSQASVNRVILSSEEFEFITDPRLLLGLLPKDTRVILYLRRPDSYLESEYNQHVRMYTLRFTGDIFRFYYRINFLGRCMYSQIVRRWSSILGAENIAIISYDKVRQSDSLLSSLHDILGIACDAKYEQISSSEQNLGMSAPAIYYMARANQVPLDKATHHGVAAVISKHFQGEPRQTMLTKSDRSLLFRSVYDEIRSIEQEYRVQLFSHPDSDMNPERPFCDFALLDQQLLASFLKKAPR